MADGRDAALVPAVQEAVMSGWKGLHNPEWHRTYESDPAYCGETGGCAEYCWPKKPCRCCLATALANVAALCDAREKETAGLLMPTTLTVDEVRAAMGVTG